MTTHATPAPPFTESTYLFENLVARLREPGAVPLDHGELEATLWNDGLALVRQLLQDHLDLRAERERREHRPAMRGADGDPRTFHDRSSRQLETKFGTVVVRRELLRQREISALIPADAELNLPREVYSHGVQLRVAEEVARGSYESAAEAVEQTTAAHVPKRQVEEAAVRAAEDFDAFYAARRMEGDEDCDDLLVMSVDGKGVVMRSEDLRPATQKAAEQARHKLGKRLSKGEKKNRKRMATVAAIWSVAAWVRTPADIVGDLRGEDSAAGPRPEPAHKRVWASVEKDPEEVIREAFLEADRRDPDHHRTWVLLVDGNKTQIRIARQEARRRGVQLTIVIDIIHVIEYLWRAAWCFHQEGDKAAETWVTERLTRVLEGKASDVAAGVRRSATLRGLGDKERKNVDSCANYLLNYKTMLRYDAALTAGLPIATGVIEGACRYLVKDRMDITGARWGLKGAEAVLKLRALRASGDLAAYWQFHTRQELLRNHVAKYHPDDLATHLPDVASR